MDRFIKSMKAFPFKGMLVIWGIFMLMGAVLFAERSGIHYEGSKSQSAYLSENQIVTEKEAVKELKKTCVLLTCVLQCAWFVPQVRRNLCLVNLLARMSMVQKPE